MLQHVIILVYLLAMSVLGMLSRKQARNAANFYVAGRKGSTPYITGSLFATIVGGSATLGMAGLGFSRGLTGIWWLLAGSIGLIVLGTFLARKVRDFGLYTLAEIAEKQYGQWVGLAVAALISIAWLGVIAGQIVAAGKIMGVLGTGDPTLWMVVFTAVFVLYTVLGGQWAVVKTDTWQSAIIFIGLFTGLGVVVSRLGGFGAMWDSLPAGYSSFPLSEKFGAYDLVKMLLLVGLTYVVGPDMYSRILSARDGRTARRAVFWTAGLLVPLGLGIVLLGMGAFALFPSITSEQAVPAVIKEVLPPAAGGLVLAALLCAVMSSADTCLLSASTILSVDIIRKLNPKLNESRVLLITRGGVVVLGLISLGLALYLKGIINSLLFAYTVYTAGVIPLVLAGFWRERLKVTPSGALAALAGGGGTALVSQLMKIKYLDVGALGISVALLFAVSWLDRALRSKTTV
jgi:SSS family solute:Na+ symporter